MRKYAVRSAIRLYALPLAYENRQTWSEVTRTGRVNGDVCHTRGDVVCMGEYSNMRTREPSAVMCPITSDWCTSLETYGVGCALTRALRTSLQ